LVHLANSYGEQKIRNFYKKNARGKNLSHFLFSFYRLKLNCLTCSC
jgi:hypothetical protein